MKRPKREKINTAPKQEALTSNPFEALNVPIVPDKEATQQQLRIPRPDVPEASSTVKRGRLDIKRVKAGRGGKTVTLIEGTPLVQLPQGELESLAHELKKVCGVGGSVQGKTIEIQGDQRERLMDLLKLKGYTPVIAGG